MAPFVLLFFEQTKKINMANVCYVNTDSVIMTHTEGQQGQAINVRGQFGCHYREVPLTGMGAAVESHGQSCLWGLQCLNKVS